MSLLFYSIYSQYRPPPLIFFILCSRKSGSAYLFLYDALLAGRWDSFFLLIEHKVRVIFIVPELLAKSLRIIRFMAVRRSYPDNLWTFFCIQFISINSIVGFENYFLCTGFYNYVIDVLFSFCKLVGILYSH